MNLETTVRRTIDSHELLKVGDRVLVALSGGPDSVALLHVLAQLASHYRLTLSAVYVNHRIRKRAALVEEKFCQSLCARMRIPLIVEREDVPALAVQRKIGIEEAGRLVRYRLFERLIKTGKFDKVALGHHADDRVETILFRIIRGTGPTGLAGIPVKRGPYIRPLFDAGKAEILEFLSQHRLRFCIDQSNDRTEFARNYIRKRLLPELRRRLNPQVNRAVLALSETVAIEDAELRKKVERAIRRAVTISHGGKIELDRARFAGYTTWLRRRLLRYCLGSSSGDSAVDRTTVDRLDDLITKGDGSLSLPGRVQAVKTESSFVFVSGPPIQVEEGVGPGKTTEVWPLRAEVKMRIGRNREGASKRRRRALRVMLAADKVTDPLTIRSFRAGDRFQPLGMRGTKKVGDFLTDRKVPKVYRDEILVVTDDRGIIWVVGHEIADRVKVDKTTRKVVTLEVNFAKRALAPTI